MKAEDLRKLGLSGQGGCAAVSSSNLRTIPLYQKWSSPSRPAWLPMKARRPSSTGVETFTGMQADALRLAVIAWRQRPCRRSGENPHPPGGPPRASRACHRGKLDAAGPGGGSGLGRRLLGILSTRTRRQSHGTMGRHGAGKSIRLAWHPARRCRARRRHFADYPPRSTS